MLTLLVLLSILPNAAGLHGLKNRLQPHSRPASSSEVPPPVYNPQTPFDTAIDWGDSWQGPTQHSGFLTFEGVERNGITPTINTFFWLLPALNLDPEAPTLVWLQGGPGGSSLYGMFEEIGPMGVDANMTIYPRCVQSNNITWTDSETTVVLPCPNLTPPLHAATPSSIGTRSTIFSSWIIPVALGSLGATMSATPLKEDWMRGVVDMLVPLMESDDVKVLVYSGQVDIM